MRTEAGIRRARAALLLGLAALVAPALGAFFLVPQAPAAVSDCVPQPDPARWEDAGTPDQGRANMAISAHRGAASLAPENTLPAYEYAIAYGMDLIEVDVQQTLDGRFVAFHDSTVERKTDGSGSIATMSYDEVRRLNAADNDRWRGTEYDPAQIPSLEEVLDLARRTGAGIYFDMKESVSDVPGLVALARSYGVVERSAFLPYDPARAAEIEAVDPEAPLMFSNFDSALSPAALFALALEYEWFGSSLPNYTPEKIAAIHDGCGLVIPNVYQGKVTGSEAGDLLYARAIGSDGAQVANPDVAADALDEPVATQVAARVADDGSTAVCLLDARHALGLPGKRLSVDGAELTSRRGGCASAGTARRGTVAFAGDGSALPSCARFRRPRDARPGDPLPLSPCRGRDEGES